MTDAQEEWSPYHFGYNNSMNFVDFSGMIPEEFKNLAVCPTCPSDPKFDPYRNSPLLFHYDPETGVASTSQGATIYGRSPGSLLDDVEKHFNGVNDIFFGLGLTQFKNQYNNHHNHVSKTYYEFHKKFKNRIKLPKPGRVRQSLKKIFSTSSKAPVSSIIKKVGVVGAILTATKVSLDAYDDGKLKPSSTVDIFLLVGGGVAVLAGSPFAITAFAVGALTYGITDYVFDIGGKLDNKFSDIPISSQ
jgi:hypothetical protein